MTTESDYKDTLNLPNTDFPMKANLAQREPEMLQRWAQLNIYSTAMNKRNRSKSFLLIDGPPYANGDIHIGHALNKILKDIVLKSKSLSGYYTPYIPGWDCHGLPIELQVEKKFGKPGVKIDANEFRAKCREYATQQIDIQRNSFKRLGVFAYWDQPYATMDYAFEANIIRALGKALSNGHLVRGDRPVHWCVDCGSALAEAEVEYADKSSDAIDVKFVFVDQAKAFASFKLKDRAGDGPISVAIWTTTPWTLPANQGVALNSKLNYALVQYKQDRIVVAEDLVESVMARYGATENDFTILGTCQGKDLELQLVQHPFYDRQVPIVLGDHVTLDAGTGAVHTAPAHGNEDYTVGLAYDLPIDNPVDANGCFISQTPLFAKLHISKANPEIIKVLQERGNLLAHAKLTHSFPHCWRHKGPLIFRATPQWFISMEQNGLRTQALQAIKNVAWIPQWGEARITAMIGGRPDWCISRQRTWGTPLALLIHKETGDMHPHSAEIISKVADLVAKGGVQAWFDIPITDLISESEAEMYTKSTDTLDVWFDSGAVHYCVSDQRPELAGLPVDLYLEGSDQHRGWFQSSLLSSIATKNVAPYKQVLTHGFTVDADGRKMSKSLGNVIAPEKVMQSLGADVLRLWVASTDYRADLCVSDEILKRTSDAYRRIRNTARFLLANLNGFDPKTDIVQPDQMLMLDRWIVQQTKDLQSIVEDAYQKYEFHVIYQRVHNFCSDELGSFYLDVIKDRQYTGKADGIPRRSCQTALYYIAEALVRWVAPIISFTADEIWQNIPGERNESVFLETWYDKLPTMPEDAVFTDDYWHQILNIRDEVNKVLETKRREGIIGSGLEAEVTLFADGALLTNLKHLKDELRFVLITSKAEVMPIVNAHDNAVSTEIPGLKIVVHAATSPKCQRCWHRREDVDQNPKYPNICQRCVTNLTTGEERIYA